MIIEYTGRQTSITEKLKVQAAAGLDRIAKIIGSDGCSAHVILTIDKYRKIAEVTIACRAGNLVATCEGVEMQTALHDALAKIEQQAVRQHQKSTTIMRHPRSDPRTALEAPALSA